MRRASSGRVDRAAYRALAVGAVAAAWLGSVFASVAVGATVTIGAPDLSSDQGRVGCTAQSVVCSATLAQLTQPTPDVLLTAPADGVITAWRVHGSTDNGLISSGSLALRVLRGSSSGLFTGVATSAAVKAIDIDGSPPHAVSIPVRAGDYIGVDAVVTSASPSSGAEVFVTLPSGAAFSSWSGGLADGSTAAPSSTPPGRLMLNAVESLRPAVSAVSPSSGSTAGGQAVMIGGSDLDGATGVSFGATPAAGFTVVSATRISAVAPAQAQGAVDVQVTGPGGVSPLTGGDNYSYVQAGSTLPPGGGAVLAKVGSERLAPSSFAAAPSGPSAVSARRKYGTRVTYTLNEAASVRFTVTQARAGRRASHGRCVAPTRRNRRARRCTRVVTLNGSFTRIGEAATNSFRFTGRIGGKRLKPGSYKLVATPKANGRAGRAVSVTFHIIK